MHRRSCFYEYETESGSGARRVGSGESGRAEGSGARAPRPQLLHPVLVAATAAAATVRACKAVTLGAAATAATAEAAGCGGCGVGGGGCASRRRAAAVLTPARDSARACTACHTMVTPDADGGGVTGPRSHSPLASLTMFAGLNVNLSSTSYISIIYAYHNGHTFH